VQKFVRAFSFLSLKIELKPYRNWHDELTLAVVLFLIAGQNWPAKKA